MKLAVGRFAARYTIEQIESQELVPGGEREKPGIAH